MNDTVKIAIVIASALIGSSGAMAAPVNRAINDPSVEPIHLDNSAVPAKQYFEEMQRDGQ